MPNYDQDAVDEAVRVAVATLEPRILALEARTWGHLIERQVVHYVEGGSDTYILDPTLSTP